MLSAASGIRSVRDKGPPESIRRLFVRPAQLDQFTWTGRQNESLAPSSQKRATRAKVDFDIIRVLQLGVKLAPVFVLIEPNRSNSDRNRARHNREVAGAERVHRVAQLERGRGGELVWGNLSLSPTGRPRAAPIQDRGPRDGRD